MKKLFGVFMSRATDIIDEELLDDDMDTLKDEVFSQLSATLIEEKRLIKRFYDFCDEYNNFEFDEMGLNMDEADDILRKTNKIRDLFLSNIEEKLLFIFNNVESNTLTRIITLDLDTKENNFKVVIEVMSDSFNLELQERFNVAK